MNLHPMINIGALHPFVTPSRSKRAWFGIVSVKRVPPTLKRFFNLLAKKSARILAHELEAKVFPANRVPTPVVDVLNKPIFEMFAVAVTKLFADAKAPVNWLVPEATIELETAARPEVECVNSPVSEVASEAGAPPVPSAI